MSVAFVVVESSSESLQGSLQGQNQGQNQGTNLGQSADSSNNTLTASLGLSDGGLSKGSLSEESLVKFYSCMLPTGWASDSFLPVDILPVDKSACEESDV
ncbi:MAG: hypothetical protein WA901_14925 [Phormidesmis sp.]